MLLFNLIIIEYILIKRRKFSLLNIIANEYIGVETMAEF